MILHHFCFNDILKLNSLMKFFLIILLNTILKSHVSNDILNWSLFKWYFLLLLFYKYPIHIAIENDDIEMIQLLINHQKLDFNVRSIL
mgnify:CR=1 FL=1